MFGSQDKFSLSKDKSLLSDMDALFVKKKDITDRLMHTSDETTKSSLKKELLSIIEGKQIPLVKFLDKNSSSQFKFLLDQVAKHLATQQLDIMEKLGRLSKVKETMMIESLELDLRKILETCRSLNEQYTKQSYVLNHDSNALGLKGTDEYKNCFDRETSLVSDLNNLLAKDSELEKNINEHLRMVQELEYSAWWSKIIKGFSKLFVVGPYKVVVTGRENIPITGPVILASRHYHGDVDGGLLINIVPRRMFLLTGIDWIPSKAVLKVSRFTFSKIGGIAMNRPDSPNKREDYPDSTMPAAVRKVVSALHMNQAVLIFPEGWPNIDSHYTPKKFYDGIIPLKPGLVRIVDLAQKSLGQKIPIIPVGLIYHGVNDSKAPKGTPKNTEDKLIEVNFGKVMVYEGNSNDADRETFCERLREQIVILSKL